jgi:cell division transport system ATP-binding protein
MLRSHNAAPDPGFTTSVGGAWTSLPAVCQFRAGRAAAAPALGSPAAERTVVRLEQIGKRWDDGAEPLHDISLALQPGDFRFLTGASGAGKTTLLNIIGLVERPSQGSLSLFDHDVWTLDRAARAALRRRIGVVFQDFRLLDELSVHDNVALPLRVAGAPEIGDHIAELLGWLGIEDRVAARPSVLSASEKQRVALARAVVHRPELLLADEPTGHVDDDTALLLVRAFERINALGTTVLIATHDTAFTRRFDHPRLHLANGTLAAHAAGETQ